MVKTVINFIHYKSQGVVKLKLSNELYLEIIVIVIVDYGDNNNFYFKMTDELLNNKLYKNISLVNIKYLFLNLYYLRERGRDK